MQVVYGHTDSIYVTIDSISEAKKVCKHLNAHVQSLFPNELNLPVHPVQLEFEKFFQTLGVGTVMNRNAGLISWKDGVTLSKPEFMMTGFTAKRQSVIPLEKEVQTKVIKMWVNECTQSEITEYSRGMFNKVKLGNTNLELLAKRQRVKENRLKVKCPDCRKRYDLKDLPNLCECGTSKQFFTTLEGKKPSIGSGFAGLFWWNNTEIGRDKPINDSMYFVKVNTNSHNEFWVHPLSGMTKKVEWISAPSFIELKELLEGGIQIDYMHYADKVVSKSEPIYKAMNWSTESISLDERQQTLTEWF